MKRIQPWPRERINRRSWIHRKKQKKEKWQSDLRKEEGRQSSNPRRESEVGELVERVSGGGAACGSAEESVIISSISDKGSVINTDLVSGSLLASLCAACDVAMA